MASKYLQHDSMSFRKVMCEFQETYWASFRTELTITLAHDRRIKFGMSTREYVLMSEESAA